MGWVGNHLIPARDRSDSNPRRALGCDLNVYVSPIWSNRPGEFEATGSVKEDGFLQAGDVGGEDEGLARVDLSVFLLGGWVGG